MNCEQIASLLNACSHMDEMDGEYTTGETAIIDVLLKAGTSGPVPIARVKRVVLRGEHIELETEEHSYLIASDAFFGIKWTAKETRVSRTGFHA